MPGVFIAEALIGGTEQTSNQVKSTHQMHRLVFEESGKLESEPEKNLSVQSRE